MSQQRVRGGGVTASITDIHLRLTAVAGTDRGSIGWEATPPQHRSVCPSGPHITRLPPGGALYISPASGGVPLTRPVIPALSQATMPSQVPLILIVIACVKEKWVGQSHRVESVSTSGSRGSDSWGGGGGGGGGVITTNSV